MSDPFPDRSMEHRDKLLWMIEANGWTLAPVAAQPEASPPRPGYCYTIGVEDRFGFPEVVVFGLTPVAAGGLIGLVVDLVASGTEVPVGPQLVGLLDGEQRCALLPVDVDAHHELFDDAIAILGHQSFRVVQLAWPDRAGWLPWEPGFDATLRVAQPVIGSLAEA